MELNYSLGNLLGILYRKGNLCFSESGQLLSPVGNRITCFDIKEDKSRTLPFQSNYDLDHIALSPTANVLLAINETGEAYLCSTLTNTLIGQHHFRFPVSCVSFSPNGKYFAVCRDHLVLTYYAPSLERQVNQFYLFRTFYGATGEITHIDWSSDSRVLAASCRDRTVRIHVCGKSSQLQLYSLSFHRRPVISANFLANSLSLFTVDEGGTLCMWKCDTAMHDLKFDLDAQDGAVAVGIESKDDEDNNTNGKETDSSPEDQATADDVAATPIVEEAAEIDTNIRKVTYSYTKVHRYCHADSGDKRIDVDITRTAFHKGLNLLATGFVNGCFLLHWMPDFTPIHQLSISPDPITALAFSPRGDWLAMGCAQRGQLAVWEWRSELFRYKGQSHCTADSGNGDSGVTCVAYSGDGLTVATGGQDHRVRIWRTLAGVCFRTFRDHQAPVTAVAFPSANARVLFSASLDGSVRAMDLHKYITFRTFSSPGKPLQFSCLSVDARGDLVAAGTQDDFSALIWSVQTGKLLCTLSGHGGPVKQVAFSPGHVSTVGGPQLATGSWDKTLRLWDFFTSRDAKELVQLNAEVVAMTYRQDGLQLAVATLDCELAFYNSITAELEHSIETYHDAGDSKQEGEEISARQASLTKCFLALCYTSSGCHLICGGSSKYICIYNVAAEVLVRRIAITVNHSLSGVLEMHGKQQHHIIERLGGGGATAAAMTKRRQLFPSERERRRFDGAEVKVVNLQYSPCGDGFAACTTEGLMLFTNNLFSHHECNLAVSGGGAGTSAAASFQPGLGSSVLPLDASVTPESVHLALQQKEPALALQNALKLSTVRPDLLELVIEKIPLDEASFHVRQLGGGSSSNLLQALLSFIIRQLTHSRHLHFYLHWADQILCQHASLLKHKAFQYDQKLSDHNRDLRAVAWSAQLIALQNPLKEKEKLLRRTVDWLDRTTDFLQHCPKEEDSDMEDSHGEKEDKPQKDDDVELLMMELE